MRALVVYESMYGNTHRVADAIGRGLARGAEVAVVPVDRADRELVDAADLVVVGGPTHVHGMTRASTRRAAVDEAHKPGAALALDPDAGGAGLREWFTSIGRIAAESAAFDTRIDAPAVLTGRASKGIARELRNHGSRLVVEPESFLVTKESDLEPGEERRAEEWGGRLIREAGAGAEAAAESPRTAR